MSLELFIESHGSNILLKLAGEIEEIQNHHLSVCNHSGLSPELQWSNECAAQFWIKPQILIKTYQSMELFKLLQELDNSLSGHNLGHTEIAPWMEKIAKLKGQKRFDNISRMNDYWPEEINTQEYAEPCLN